MPEQELIVGQPNSGERLDIFLVHQFADTLSRTVVKRLIDEGGVIVNGKNVRAGYKIHTGDHVHIHREDDAHQPQEILPEKIPLDIIYEDDWLLVLNKPEGMLVHPARGRMSGTLVNALMHHCEKLSTVNDADRPGIVHRLDRDTSGIMIAVKDNAVHENLAKQFKRHKNKKKYIAVVKGIVELDEGIIDAPIARHAVHFDKKAIARGGREGRRAQTRYQVQKRIGSCATVAALFPKTGRTHQLRVHMKYIGHPILGDEKYGNAKAFPRLALHAHTIRFYHPGLSKFMEFCASLPEEFVNVEKYIQK